MMTTQEQIKIQKLESLDDLELLAVGDVIETLLHGCRGKAIILKNEDQFLSLIKRQPLEEGEGIMEYSAPKSHYSVENGRLIQNGVVSSILLSNSFYEKIYHQYGELLKRIN
ncbi:MAG: hypothetical protein AABX48_04185 [Nanoarchaeota archaeon]